MLNIDGRRSLALGMLRSDDVRDDAEQRVREALEPDAHVRAFREHDVIDRRCALDEAEHTLADVVRDDVHRHMLAYTAEPTW